MLKEFGAEVPGMLWRAIRGWMDLRARGQLDPPAAVLDATTEYRAEEDQLGNFLAECTIQAPKSVSVSTKSLFLAYGKWCDEQDEWKVAKTQRSFNAKLSESGIMIDEDRDKFKHVVGISLRSDIKLDGNFL